jgi:hypothetical protein
LFLTASAGLGSIWLENEITIGERKINMSKVYHRDFFDPKELSLGNITKKHGKVVSAELSFKCMSCEYNFELGFLHNPVDLDKNIIQWDDLEVKLRVEIISKIVIHRDTKLFSIGFWQNDDILGIIHCKDIKGLPEQTE